MSLNNLLRVGLFIFLSLSLTAHGAVTQTAAQALQKLLSPINSLSAEFTQQIKDLDNNEYQRLTGNLILMKPNHLRWNVIAPMTQLVVSDGKLIWLYDPDLEQVVIQPFTDDFTANPISILLGNLDQLNNDFYVTRSDENSFFLKPKQLNSLFVAFQLTFTDNVLSHIDYQDSFGHRTRLSLTQVKLNPSFSKTAFVFDIPQDVDIINHAK
jgi:outer membrane lipoprotein carrier protein